jgi:hypothetical protein
MATLMTTNSPKRLVRPSGIPAESRGHGGKRKRPPLVLPKLQVPTGIPIEEWAVPLSVAAELVRVTTQAIWVMTERRTLPAYIGPDGVRYVRLVDLAESRCGERQAAKEYEQASRRVSHEIYHTGEYEECLECLVAYAPPTTEVFKRPWPDPTGSRRAQLEQARQKAHATNRRKREEKMAARTEPTL